jgi:hypothetical protein
MLYFQNDDLDNALDMHIEGFSSNSNFVYYPISQILLPIFLSNLKFRLAFFNHSNFSLWNYSFTTLYFMFQQCFILF